MRILTPVKTAASYFRASPLPHATALGAMLAGMELIWSAIYLRTHEMDTITIGIWLWGIFWMVVATFALMDGLSRYREYCRIKDMLQRKGFNRRVFLVVAGSRCQRDAAMLAARETGFHTEARKLFNRLGYRWYHLLPDAVMRNPLLFFHPRFLKNSFMPGKAITHAAKREACRLSPQTERA